MSAKTYGLIAEFDSPAAVLRAAERVHDAGYRRWDVFSPFPVHGLDKVMGLHNSRVGWFSFVFGAGAFVGTMLMIWYMNDFDYPILTGGKPMFSAPLAVVPSYILLVLAAAIGTFFTLYLLFVRFLPMIPVSEVKAVTPQADPHHPAGGSKGAIP